MWDKQITMYSLFDFSFCLISYIYYTGLLNSLVDLKDAVIGKTQIESHFCVIFCFFFKFGKTLANIGIHLFEFSVQISRHNYFYFILSYYLQNVFLLRNRRKLLKLSSCQSHQEIYLFISPFKILNGKSIKRCIFHSQLQTVEQTFFQSLSSKLVTRQSLFINIFSISSITVHDKGNVLWYMSLFHDFYNCLFQAVKFDHMMMC